MKRMDHCLFNAIWKSAGVMVIWYCESEKWLTFLILIRSSGFSASFCFAIIKKKRKKNDKILTHWSLFEPSFYIYIYIYFFFFLRSREDRRRKNWGGREKGTSGLLAQTCVWSPFGVGIVTSMWVFSTYI